MVMDSFASVDFSRNIVPHIEENVVDSCHCGFGVEMKFSQVLIEGESGNRRSHGDWFHLYPVM